ncbi:MAG TPA: RsbRD N-terminal domain-containing protein [bacterium]|nr:RsbRD N-terminal domain-containing protein [bacterium]
MSDTDCIAAKETTLLEMELKILLKQNKAAILTRWSRMIQDTYAAETACFLSGERDQFANPVGFLISAGIEELFDALLTDDQPDRIPSTMVDLIRIRAVQEFTPAQAVGFLFLLKTAIREESGRELRQQDLEDLLFALEHRIDTLVLLAFNLFMECREKVYDLKAREIKRQTFMLLERVNQPIPASLLAPSCDVPVPGKPNPEGGIIP